VKTWKAALALGCGLAAFTPLRTVDAEPRAIRHSAVSCFGSLVSFVDLFTPGTLHDWGAVTKNVSGETTLFCPVTLDVPRVDGTPIDAVRVIYSTREFLPSTNAGPVMPAISSCTVFLMDGTDAGTWVQTSDPSMGANTGSLRTDGEIMIHGSTVPLGGPKLDRMLITCQLPKAVIPSGGTLVSTTMVKGYEVQYSTPQ
jgi:hypothetical protein